MGNYVGQQVMLFLNLTWLLWTEYLLLFQIRLFVLSKSHTQVGEYRNKDFIQKRSH